MTQLVAPPIAFLERPLALNRLLASLEISAPDDAEWLASQLVPVSLALGQVLAAADEPFAAVYFPTTTVISMICRMNNGDATEVGTIGNEGVVGASILLGAEPDSNETVAQIAGSAFMLAAGVMRQAMTERPAICGLILRYLHEYLTEVAQTAACNRLHGIEARCARWLLMTHDRVGRADQFPLTQGYLAIMLGVRRAGVTVAAGALQDAGIIRYRRGSIRVLDREGLEAVACECYGVVRRHFDRLVL